MDPPCRVYLFAAAPHERDQAGDFVGGKAKFPPRQNSGVFFKNFCRIIRFSPSPA